MSDLRGAASHGHDGYAQKPSEALDGKLWAGAKTISGERQTFGVLAGAKTPAKRHFM
jgi:hypothetical protein